MQRRPGPRLVQRRADTRAAAPLALRVLHALVFLALGGFALARSWPEWRHLARAVSAPLHWGTPPSPPLLLAGLLALVGIVALVVALARRRPPPLRLSLPLLAACLLALAPATGPEERRIDSANAALLSCARELKTQMHESAQALGSVPGEAAWRRELQAVCPQTLRDRTFTSRPPALNWLAEERVPVGATAGTLSVYRSPDGVRFGLHPTGWNPSGDPIPLPDARGEPLWFKGAFLPAF